MDENPYEPPRTNQSPNERQSPSLWRSVVSLLFIIFGVIFLFAIVAEVVIASRKGFSSLVVLHIARDIVVGSGLIWAGFQLRKRNS
jgi:hypothetical protein